MGPGSRVLAVPCFDLLRPRLEDKIITSAVTVPSFQKRKIVRSDLSSKGFGEPAKRDAGQMEMGALGKEVVRYLRSEKIIWTKNTTIGPN